MRAAELALTEVHPASPRRFAAARARGRNGGWPAELTAEHVRQARRMLDKEGKTVTDVAAFLRVPRPTLYRALDDAAEAST